MFTAAATLMSLALPITMQSTTHSSAATSPARLSLGRELAEVLNSEALTRTQLSKVMDVTLPQQIAADPNFAVLERERPGISKAVVTGMRTVVIEECVKLLPSLWERLAQIYAADLNEQDLAAMLAFYRSPTCVRLIDTIGRESDYSQLIAKQLRSGGAAEIAGDDLTSGAAPGIASAIRSATPEDEAAFRALVDAVGVARIDALNAKTHAEVVRWSNEPSPEVEAKIEAAVVSAMEPFLARQPRSPDTSKSKVKP